jgi:predicted nucleic acid-binding Zn finger protein
MAADKDDDEVAMEQRIDRALKQNIYLLENQGNGKFHVAGMTNDYHTELRTDGHTCTCPDFTRRQAPCKHIYWLLFKYFRISRKRWRKNPKLMPDEKEMEVSHQNKRDREDIDGDCVICLDPLSQGALQECNTCQQHIHLKCVSVWLRHASHGDCPLCRQPMKIQNMKRRKTCH